MQQSKRTIPLRDVAAGIRMPLRALVQKLWDADRPALSWTAFKAWADRLG